LTWKSLSVGCNGNRECDFNTDIKMYVKKELACSGLYLPFQDNSFEVVFSSHVIEHVKNPYQFLRELKRVARRIVVLKIPNSKFYKRCQLSHEHIFGWNIFEFENFLLNEFGSVKVYGSMRTLTRNKLNTIKVYVMSFLQGEPNELVAICRKTEAD
jgi:SAM-dependent methyltransferase